MRNRIFICFELRKDLLHTEGINTRNKQLVPQNFVCCMYSATKDRRVPNRSMRTVTSGREESWSRWRPAPSSIAYTTHRLSCTATRNGATLHFFFCHTSRMLKRFSGMIKRELSQLQVSHIIIASTSTGYKIHQESNASNGGRKKHSRRTRRRIDLR